MAKRTRTYVCFDADNDMEYYRTMQMWKANDNIDFDFNNAHELNTLRATSSEETIKAKLRERMKNSKMLVVLIGDDTKNLYKYIRWEIELALEMDIPIIAVNINGKKERDDKLCPPILKDELALHINFGSRIMQYALDNWPQSYTKHKSNDDSGPYHYKDFVYDKLEQE